MLQNLPRHNAQDIHAELEHLTNTLQKGEIHEGHVVLALQELHVTYTNILRPEDFSSFGVVESSGQFVETTHVDPPQSSSAVQPVAINFGDFEEENLANGTADVSGQCGYEANFIDYLTSKLMWDEVLNDNVPKGLSSEAARDPARRIKHVLDLVDDIRMAYIHEDMTKCSPTNPLDVPIDKVLTDDDMRQVFNTWRNNHEDWMDEETLRMLPQLTRKKRQAKIHQAFSTMQFQLLGNKHLIHYLIKYPLRSAEQRADAIKAFLEEWEVHCQSEEYRHAVADRRPCKKNHKRLSQQIWEANQKLERCKWVSEWVDQWWLNLYHLQPSERTLYRQYQLEELQQQLDALKTQQRAASKKFPGVVAWMSRHRQT